MIAKSTNEDNSRLYYLVFICTASALGGFLFGFDSIVVSGTIPQIKSMFHLTAYAEGLFVSSSLVGCMVSAPFAGNLSDRFGRRSCLFAAGALTLISCFACTVANDIGLLIVSRFVGGMGAGAASMVCPLYISEVSPPQWRGRLVTLYQFAITIGICGALFSNAALDGLATAAGHGTLAGWIGRDTWRAMFASQALPSSVFLALCFLVPETPRWLVKVGRQAEAISVLRRLLPSRDAERTAREIVETVAVEAQNAVGYCDLLRPGYRRALFVALFLAIASELSGITVVFYYGPAILNDAGFAVSGALDGFASIGVVNMAATLIALWLIDRVGRRPLLMAGTSGAILCLIAVGALLRQGPGGNLLLVAAICGYVAFFAFSIGPVKFVVASEIFPNLIRGRAVAVFIFAAFAAGALVNQLFPLIRDHVGPQASFYLFALVLVPQIVFVWKVMPETARRTLEEIEQSWTPMEPGDFRRGSSAKKEARRAVEPWLRPAPTRVVASYAVLLSIPTSARRMLEMKTALFAVAIATLSFPGAAFADDLTGVWKITGDVADNAVDTVCTFSGSGDKTTASCTVRNKAPAVAPVKITGKDAAWDWDVGEAILTFKGTLDTDKTMKGDIEVGGVTGSFTAAKQ